MEWVECEQSNHRRINVFRTHFRPIGILGNLFARWQDLCQEICWKVWASLKPNTVVKRFRTRLMMISTFALYLVFHDPDTKKAQDEKLHTYTHECIEMAKKMRAMLKIEKSIVYIRCSNGAVMNVVWIWLKWQLYREANRNHDLIDKWMGHWIDFWTLSKKPSRPLILYLIYFPCSTSVARARRITFQVSWMTWRMRYSCSWTILVAVRSNARRLASNRISRRKPTCIMRFASMKHITRHRLWTFLWRSAVSPNCADQADASLA